MSADIGICMKESMSIILSFVYVYQHTAWMRSRLQKHSTDVWKCIYTTAVIRVVYDCRFRRMQLHYEDNILSLLYLSGSVFYDKRRYGVPEHVGTDAWRDMELYVGNDYSFLLFDRHLFLKVLQLNS